MALLGGVSHIRSALSHSTVNAQWSIWCSCWQRATWNFDYQSVPSEPSAADTVCFWAAHILYWWEFSCRVVHIASISLEDQLIVVSNIGSYKNFHFASASSTFSMETGSTLICCLPPPKWLLTLYAFLNFVQKWSVPIVNPGVFSP